MSSNATSMLPFYCLSGGVPVGHPLDELGTRRAREMAVVLHGQLRQSVPVVWASASRATEGTAQLIAAFWSVEPVLAPVLADLQAPELLPRELSAHTGAGPLVLVADTLVFMALVRHVRPHGIGLDAPNSILKLYYDRERGGLRYGVQIETLMKYRTNQAVADGMLYS